MFLELPYYIFFMAIASLLYSAQLAFRGVRIIKFSQNSEDAADRIKLDKQYELYKREKERIRVLFLALLALVTLTVLAESVTFLAFTAHVE